MKFLFREITHLLLVDFDTTSSNSQSSRLMLDTDAVFKCLYQFFLYVFDAHIDQQFAISFSREIENLDKKKMQ